MAHDREIFRGRDCPRLTLAFPFDQKAMHVCAAETAAGAMRDEAI